nr:reverse transcriptase domain-containing protein [Tanacetum cinerariifolium]
ISPDVAELKDMVKALLLDKKSENQAPATVKTVEEISTPRPNLRPSIPYPSRLQDQKLRDKANDQLLLKKLPKKLGDPGKFLIPCDFLGKAECLALADLGASINLMPLSVWNKLSLPDLSHTCMTLELADRLIPRPIGVAEDVYVKVEIFPKTGRALIDVFEGDLTLRVGKEAINFNPDQTSRYLANYSNMTAKRFDVIDMACGEYSQEVLGFSDVIASGNPTPYYDPIISTTSLTLTPFENSDFLLEEVDAFLAIEDDHTSPEVDQSYLDPEGDILLLEASLNDDPSLRPPNQGNYLHEVHKELKICEAKSNKSSIDEPPEVELKDLPPHLEYAFLEGDDKFPVIIAKDLSMEEKTALTTVLKSHNPWVSPVHYVPKKGGFTVMENEDNELIPTRLVTGWRVCIDYRKLNEATRKDHFPLPFMDQMLERLAGNQYYCVLDGFFGYFQIPIIPKDQEKTTFTCPYRMFAYRRIPFGLCNAPGTFQSYLSHLERMLKRCKDTNLCLNWEKSYFMVKEGKNRASWLDKLDDALWPFRTAYKTPIGCTPYKPVYGKACHFPIELEHKAYWALKHANFDLKTAGDHKKVQLNELNELRDQANENSLIYKEKTKRLHDFKIKDRVFNIDNKVLLFNSRLKIFSRKLKSRWSGPFTISHVYPYGTVELSQPDGPNFKVNGHRLMLYFGEDVPKLVVPDLQTFPKDY